ncbi:hypothetical protein [Jannaschia pohangensis]|uniref:Uncharacterized protein n=1 Tax=Jannaschia pohangensis TaxID=390807 RepID=A0A1I3P017_9RHOB|nr:hypothetical protein [Jannaschia pohangensis]SFJ14908.1 hypothetical protein SAMN04488095_2304 [Jannaschia pohangensis]
MRVWLSTAIVAIVWAGMAPAYVADNHSWSMTCNGDGFVLTSDYPVARYIEAGAQSDVKTGIEKLYLGRSCDATNTHLGKGSWCFSNGGFRARFETGEIAFPRQEPICETAAPEMSGCQC